MARTEPEAALTLARDVAARYAALPEVVAVALGGSRGTGAAGADSDVDLYVYAEPEIPLAQRAAIAWQGAARAEVGNAFFEPGDEWVDRATGVAVDVMFREPRWIEEQLDRVLLRHEASTGYSTAFWHNVRASVALFDRSGWYATLQARSAAPYPEALRRGVVARNRPLLRNNRSSYLRQIEQALARGDLVSVNHRVAAFLASWFDVLFAVNRLPHPGEKRLVELAEALCLRRPPGAAEAVRALLAAVPGPGVVARANALADGLDALLREEGLL
jgi:predicted nucleotidyltransferase